ncbi:MAG: thioredoxin family protein [Rhodospirillales bacterium]|tara:strand:- start:19151 stop:19420 length:270 start_codon:yes stop_codon:yes gene_type:complete
MTTKRQIEIFSAGCAVCSETVKMVEGLACPSCEITVLDMSDAGVAARAKSLGFKSLPAVVIDGALAGCCAGRGPNAEDLKAAGLGQPLS